VSRVHDGSQKAMTAAAADTLTEDSERRIQITENAPTQLGGLK